MDASKINTYTEDDYYNLPEDVRAELINGQIYYQAAPSRLHQELSGELYYIIRNYIKTKGGSCKVYPAPFAVKLFNNKKTIVEPDISVICDPDKLTDKGCSGAPDWIIEITSPGTSSNDYVLKLNLYMEAGVKEYWIVDSQSRKILVYLLTNDAFSVETYTFQDNIKASIYEDLYIRISDLNL